MLVSDFVLDPRTMRDIRMKENGCGCHERGPKWFVCDYHEGFDAALEQHGESDDGS